MRRSTMIVTTFGRNEGAGKRFGRIGWWKGSRVGPSTGWRWMRGRKAAEANCWRSSSTPRQFGHCWPDQQLKKYVWGNILPSCADWKVSKYNLPEKSSNVNCSLSCYPTNTECKKRENCSNFSKTKVFSPPLLVNFFQNLTSLKSRWLSCVHLYPQRCILKLLLLLSSSHIWRLYSFLILFYLLFY